MKRRNFIQAAAAAPLVYSLSYEYAFAEKIKLDNDLATFMLGWNYAAKEDKLDLPVPKVNFFKMPGENFTPYIYNLRTDKQIFPIQWQCGSYTDTPVTLDSFINGLAGRVRSLMQATKGVWSDTEVAKNVFITYHGDSLAESWNYVDMDIVRESMNLDPRYTFIKNAVYSTSFLPDKEVEGTVVSAIPAVGLMERKRRYFTVRNANV